MTVSKVIWFGLKAIGKLTLIAVFIASLAINASFFVGGAISQTASLAYEAVTGIKSWATRNTEVVADLSDELTREKKIARETKEQLNAEKRVSRKLRGDLAQASGQHVTFKGRRMKVSAAVEATAENVSRRARNSALRETSSIFAEALPWVGTAVIVGVTAAELKDLCDTISDMQALKQALDPGLAPSEDERTVCALRVPTQEEVWEAAKASPGQAWDKAQKMTPSLEDIRTMKMPAIDWASYGDALSDASAAAADATGSSLRDLWSRMTGGDDGVSGEGETIRSPDSPSE